MKTNKGCKNENKAFENLEYSQTAILPRLLESRCSPVFVLITD
jgi:hypothetical protein